MGVVLPLKSLAGAGNARSVGEFAPGDVMDPVYVGITGAASTILTSNLTAGVVLVSDTNGKVVVSATTATELSYVHGVTSAIQAQIDGKQTTVTGAATTILASNLTAGVVLVSDTNGKVAVSATTATELSYVHGVTSGIQTQLDAHTTAISGKQATVTGGASTILTSNMTPSMVMTTDANGKAMASTTTSLELSYLNNVTSDLQIQINNKANWTLGQNIQSANYTLVLTDAGCSILHPLADTSNRTFTIPANASVAFPINTEIWFYNQVNTVTIAITSDTLRLAGGTLTGNRTLAANGVCCIRKVSATVWYAYGWGLT